MRFPISLIVVSLLACSCAQESKIPASSVALAPESPKAALADQICDGSGDWEKPTPPVRIFGNAWFVGTCGISAVLVTSDQGHVLLDVGTEAGAQLVLENIRAIGFDPLEIRALLVSHEHFDHIGGAATILAAINPSGKPEDERAYAYARGIAAEVLKRGGSDRRDPQLMTLQRFPPVAQVKQVEDRSTLKLAGRGFTAHATPGHTPGGTSWHWQECEGKRCIDMVYVDSLTAISDKTYLYSNDPLNPQAVQDFEAGIERVAQLPCGIVLTTHPASSTWWERLSRATDGNGHIDVDALIDAQACQRLAQTARRNLKLRLQQEQARLR